MKIILEGETTLVICKQCNRIVNATYKYVNHRTSDGTIIPSVLQSVCDICNSPCTIPPQSLPRIQEHFPRQEKRFEIRLTNSLSDVLNMVSQQIGLDRSLTLKMVVSLFSKDWINNPSSINKWLTSTRAKAFLNGKSEQRISGNMNSATHRLIERVYKDAGLQDKTKLYQAAIIRAESELLEKKTNPLSSLFFSAVELFRPSAVPNVVKSISNLEPAPKFGFSGSTAMTISGIVFDKVTSPLPFVKPAFETTGTLDPYLSNGRQNTGDQTLNPYFLNSQLAGASNG